MSDDTGTALTGQLVSVLLFATADEKKTLRAYEFDPKSEP